MRDITIEEFNELMDNWSKILIFFCWTNCIKCHTLEPELERVEWEMTIPLYKNNAEEDMELANMLWITSVPYLLMMEKWIKLKEYNDVNTWDFILDYFWIRIPDEHDHNQEPDIPETEPEIAEEDEE